MASLLLEAGADGGVKNGSGETPEECGRFSDALEV
jgi:hypothetical protein